MQPEEYEELAALTEDHDAMFNRLRSRGVAISLVELRLARLEAKLDLLLGENTTRALLNFQRQLAAEWGGVEDRLDEAIAEQQAEQEELERKRRLLGLDGNPLG